ncbi:class II aldolase/adducin family protein [Bradyrhizobium sp. SZCCHNS1054]|uniref:class II aldolase/adducin family protein n=1 Tax=Bradyrhizobium sp. SZCCHNS1054 TaxID=3057301 RepID=UPI0029165894|nr:class II aldolase/adducin family protein [Bradyrhizobium sp. SZCCHNS1054]
MSELGSLDGPLLAGLSRMVSKGFLHPGDTLSQRIPEADAYSVVTWMPEKRDVGPVRKLSLKGVPADIHGRVYTARPDVGAILLGRQPWACAIASLDGGMAGVFDEQIRHLGREVVRIRANSDRTFDTHLLKGTNNAFVFNDRIMCFGMGLERLLLNVELLEKCAKAYLLSISCGFRVRRIPWIVAHVANSRLKRDECEAAEYHLKGSRSVMRKGY